MTYAAQTRTPINPFRASLLGIAVLSLVVGAICVALANQSAAESDPDLAGAVGLLAFGADLARGGGIAFLFWLAASAVVWRAGDPGTRRAPLTAEEMRRLNGELD